jgi:hypothetical protein
MRELSIFKRVHEVRSTGGFPGFWRGGSNVRIDKLTMRNLTQRYALDRLTQ